MDILQRRFLDTYTDVIIIERIVIKRVHVKQHNFIMKLSTLLLWVLAFKIIYHILCIPVTFSDIISCLQLVNS